MYLIESLHRRFESPPFSMKEIERRIYSFTFKQQILLYRLALELEDFDLLVIVNKILNKKPFKRK